MDARSFAQVALRLLAVFMIFIGLAGLPSAVYVLTDHSVPIDSNVDPRLYIASLLFPMILGIVVWMVSPMLARWMVGKSEASGSFTLLDVTRVQTVAFVVLGVWLAIRALSALLVVMANSQLDSPFYWAKVVELVLSLCLIFGAKFFARLVRGIRDFGLEHLR